jgi:hypothetical protein
MGSGENNLRGISHRVLLFSCLSKQIQFRFYLFFYHWKTMLHSAFALQINQLFFTSLNAANAEVPEKESIPNILYSNTFTISIC